jgi:hypothetical protein
LQREVVMSTLEELVRCYRILVAKGVVNAYGYVCMRSQDNPCRYLISRFLAPELIPGDRTDGGGRGRHR